MCANISCKDSFWVEARWTGWSRGTTKLNDPYEDVSPVVSSLQDAPSSANLRKVLLSARASADITMMPSEEARLRGPGCVCMQQYQCNENKAKINLHLFLSRVFLYRNYISDWGTKIFANISFVRHSNKYKFHQYKRKAVMCQKMQLVIFCFTG